MNAVVVFTTVGGRYALDVAHTGPVMVLDGEPQPLPVPRPGVSGVLRVGEEMLPVLDALDASGRQLITVETGAARFLLRVGEVTGVVRLAAGAEPAPPPAGQQADVVTGVVDGALVVDPAVLAAHVGG